MATASCAMPFVWRLVVLLIVGLAPSASLAEPLPRSVLYLDENDPGLAFAREISAAFRSTVTAGSAERIAVYAENLDLVRSSGPRYEEILKTYLREKYRDRPVGVIVTIGPAALTFMLRARPELWPDVPAIFASVDPETAARAPIPAGATGLVRRQTLRDLVDVARALMPNLKRIALVGDRLERQNFRRHFQEEIPRLAAEVEIIDLTGLPMAELRKRVATLPEDTVIYFTTLTFDGDRPAYVSRDALVSVAEVANRPIVVDLDSNVGHGSVGGLVADPAPIGRDAARLALRILGGETASNIPVVAGNFARIKELVENLPDLAVLVEPLLIVRRVLREQIIILHRRLLAIVRDDDVCRRLMTVPGVGPVVSLTYRATVDVPARFRKSKSVGAVFGLTCAKYQSGEVDWSGRISRCGDEMMRVMLYEAAQSMMRSKKWSWLKAWAMQIARRCGMKKAIVALARRLAVIMHRIWIDGTEFRWTREQAVAAA